MSEDISGSVEDGDIVEVLDANFSDNPNATEILQKFQELVQNADLLNSASAYLLDELISDAIFGVFLEVHHLRKTGNLVALDGHPENCDNFEHNANAINNNNNNNNNTILPLISSLHANTANTCSSSSSSSSTNNNNNNSNSSNSSGGGNGGSGVCSTVSTTNNSSTSTTTTTTTTTTSSLRIVDLPNYDIFGMSTAKKPIDCTCPNCDRLVSAARFAPHLEKCMGMGRLSSRIASRRLATKEVNSSSSALTANSLNSTSTLTMAATYLQQTGIPTDDEDDIEWSSSSFEKRRKKINQNTRNNGTKKNNGKTC